MKKLLCTLPLVFLLGCSMVEKGAIMEDGVKLTTAPDTVHVEKGAASIEKGAVEVTGTIEKGSVEVSTAPGTIVVKTAPKTINVERGAVTFKIEQGAFVVHPNAITVNLVLGQKPPPIEKPEIKGIRPLTDSTIVKGVPDVKLAEDILNNETIYKAIIETLLKRIDIYNTNYAKEEPKK